jgi:hypothetical protein
VSEAAIPEGHPVTLKIVVPTEVGQTPMLYANHFHATITPEDMTMHLGWYATPPLTEPPTGQIEVHVQPVAKVTVPLNLIRGIVTVLQNQIQAWEQNFGQEIPAHPNPPPAMPEQKAEAER